MNKSKKLIIIFILMFFLLLKKNVVYAVSGNIYGGYVNSSSVTTGTNSGGGYSGTYQTIAAGYRVTIINSDGTEYVSSHDFWSDWGVDSAPSTGWCVHGQNGYTHLKSASKNNCTNIEGWSKYYYPNNKTSKIFGDSAKGGKSITNNSYPMKNASKEFFVDNYYYSDVYSTFGYTNISNRIIGHTVYNTDRQHPDLYYSNNYSKFAIVAMGKAINDLNGTDATAIAKAKKAFADLLRICLNDSTSTDSEVIYKVKDKILLLEPIEAVFVANAGFADNRVFVGSLHDLNYLGYPGYSNYSDRSLYALLSNVNPIVFNTKEIKNGDDVILKSCDAGTNPTNYDYKDKNLKKENGCAGIFSLDLSDLVTETCDTNAKNYISTYKNSKLSKEEARFQYLKDINEVSIDDDTGKPVYDKCIDTSSPSGYMDGSIPLYNVKEECNALDPDNVDLFENGYADSVSDDVCVKYDCNSLASAVFNKYYTSDNDKYEERIQSFKEYNSNNYLHTEFWQAMYDLYGGEKGPKCENEEIHCEVTQNVVGNCDDNGISFSDSDKKVDTQKCYLAGIAYNDENDIQTSKDKSFSNSSCNVYCFETVNFSLPGSPSGLTGKDVAAGTVLKWGVTGKNNNKFGEMTITRECRAVGNSCNLGNPMDWTDKIGTKVSVYFKTTNGSVTSTDLQTNLVEVKFNGNNPTSTSANNLSSVSCSSFSGCKNVMKSGGDFTLSAKYTFNYDEGSHWYSDKSTADGKNVTNISSDAKYIDIGYGFPVEFTNRAFVYDIYDSANNKYLWGELDTVAGYLYASIKNIGTNNGDNTYHFDKLIKENSSPTGSYVESGNEYSVRYSCPFATSNPLWDAECFDKDGNKYPLGSPYCKDEEKPKGLDVVFRTVQLINVKTYETGNTDEIEKELNKAFPGRAGNGRDIGSNWLTISDDESENTKRIFDILSNMVYAQSEPAYHIKLDTSKINFIRNANKLYRSVSLDPYTDKSNYIFDKTNAPDYSYGASDFIDSLIGKSWIDGACIIGDKDTRAKNGPCRQS